MHLDSDWSIHLRSGHCRHPFGLDAYIGQTEDSDFVPLIGPFTPNAHPIAEDLVAKLVWRLTQAVERLNSGKYVVWGALSSAQQQATTFVLGESKAWFPEPSARTNWSYLAGLTSDDLCLESGREWRLTEQDDEIIHRSGLGFRYSANCFSKEMSRMLTKAVATMSIPDQLDLRLWNSANWEASSHSLAKIGLTLLCLHQNRRRVPRSIKTQLGSAEQLAFTA